MVACGVAWRVGRVCVVVVRVGAGVCFAALVVCCARCARACVRVLCVTSRGVAALRVLEFTSRAFVFSRCCLVSFSGVARVVLCSWWGLWVLRVRFVVALVCVSVRGRAWSHVLVFELCFATVSCFLVFTRNVHALLCA